MYLHIQTTNQATPSFPSENEIQLVGLLLLVGPFSFTLGFLEWRCYVTHRYTLRHGDVTYNSIGTRPGAINIY